MLTVRGWCRIGITEVEGHIDGHVQQRLSLPRGMHVEQQNGMLCSYSGDGELKVGRAAQGGREARALDNLVLVRVHIGRNEMEKMQGAVGSRWPGRCCDLGGIREVEALGSHGRAER